MIKCRCYKKDGHPCPYKHLPDSMFCGIHKKHCTHIQDPVAPKPVAPKPVAPKPVALKPVAPKPVAPKPVKPKAIKPKAIKPRAIKPKAMIPDLVTLRTIAKGGFGETFLVQDLNTKEKYVMKKSLRKKTSQIELQYSNLEMVHKLKHPHFLAPHYISPRKDFFLMEYLDGYVTLWDVIKTHMPITKAIKHRWAQTLVLSVDLLHQHGIAHRDIKPSNIMVNTRTGDLRLIDFGISCTIKTCPTVSWSGTVFFMPPFMMKDKMSRFSFEQYEAYDWWATGLTLMYLIHPDYSNLIMDQHYNTEDLERYYGSDAFRTNVPRYNRELNGFLKLTKFYIFFFT